ncbi:MAG: hypothetical protein KKD32_09085 [Proteobacteria bacterium]|nr:hypothetical protein [Pseudomonadota bacterium]MBU1387988.1 hypothetical protein [Pseudomonadota bacterium]MBU2482835.1 hypothetical protein [Pseudomonadota bacterium]
MSSQRIVFSVILIAAAAIFGQLLFFTAFFSVREWIYPELHSTIETIGGICAILIAQVLYLEAKASRSYIFLVATGFVCMGVFDIFHAVSRGGDAFIFLHSAASLAGGLFFFLVWVPEKSIPQRKNEQRGIAWVAVFLVLSVGLRAIMYPDDVPTYIVLYDEKFTLAAVLINTLASLLFLAAIPRFYMIYRKDKDPQVYIFMCLALLFGVAEMIFQFSDKWDGIWWAWHMIRFSAFMITLIVVFQRYQRLLDRSIRIHPSETGDKHS